MKPTAIGMYIFAGGFTLGVKKHFDVQAVLEETPYGVSSARHNQPEIPVHVGFDAWPVYDLPREEELGFLYGNPPCAAWSPIGKTINNGPDHWMTDDRVDCTRVLFSALEWFRPMAWAWESVPQAYTKGRPLVHDLARRAVDQGYAVSFVLHNAQYIMGRQHRKRFFMVCHRVEIDWQCPFIEPIPLSESLKEFRAHWVDKYDKDRSPYVKIDKECWEKAGEGHALRRGYEKWGKGNKPGFSSKRSSRDKPSPAIIGWRIYHPTQFRLFSMGEMLFLSGFPPSYQMQGTRFGRASEIARGVLPPIGEWLAANVSRGLKRGVPARPRAQEVNFFKPPGAVTEVSL